MKKLIAGALLMGASTLAFAQPGCGVGAMIWKGQSGIAPTFWRQPQTVLSVTRRLV